MSINQFKKVNQKNIEVLSNNDFATSIQITDESGHFLMTIYQIFHGIQLIYSDAHIQDAYFEERKTTSNDIIEISHCREGRLECHIRDNFCYLSPDDFVVAQTNCVSSSLHFPIWHYHGLTIQIDLKKVKEGNSPLFDEVQMEPSIIAEKFCHEKGSFIAHANASLKRIFSELYNIPLNMQKEYFQIKILELILFLTTTDIKKDELENCIYTKSQVDLAKEISKYMIEHMNEHITLERLVKHFHMSGAHIKKTFKGVYGVPIGTYIRMQKMESAAYMLECTDKTILQIANEHGYENGSKFASAFRAIKGSTPTEYRNAILKINKKMMGM